MKDKFIKYSELLLKRCLSVKGGQPLLISAPIEAVEFVRVLSECALKEGVTDIYFDWYDDIIKHHELEYLSFDNLKESLFWNKEIYDVYAKKDAAFLMLVSEDIDIMNDIDSDKISFTSSVNIKSRPIYKKRQLSNEIAWCIASVSTYGWAKKVFENDQDCVNKLWELIFDICLVNTNNPIEAWESNISISHDRTVKLNNLNLKTLHYTNKLGTDLVIGLSKNTIWHGAGDKMNDGRNIICNMPTFEIFTSPNRNMTNGVVYSSKPLIYNGCLIEDFMLEFKDGKVINYKAKKGEEILKGIIFGDDNSCYLGEVALVDYNSPIQNSGVIFYTTLFDENASCHLALGSGFPDSLEGTNSKSNDELIEMGINMSDVHVDFMIGTEDLKITGVTYDNEEVVIFENGNFNISI